METLAQIESVLKEAKQKKRELILKAIDGRTQRAVALRTGIEETKLSRWINGDIELDAKELSSFNKQYKTNFTLPE
jgi:DNA-binding transcriptional regulator YdaS (Cro superfamily)